MVQTKIGHIQINVDAKNLPFYKDLFNFTGWSILYEDSGMLGIGQEGSQSLWFAGGANTAQNDYDGRGMNHLALHVQNQADVDAVVAYLREKQIPELFDTPRHRPDFSQDAAHTYYQVMFESPDRILFEVVYIGPKAE
jgi:catechol 2,3-dioxygenase-like lactoylglutathione lyase family enzyme